MNIKGFKKIPLWMQIVGDILIAVAVLCVFAYFHHVVSAEKPSDGVIITPSTSVESISWAEKFAEHFSDEVEDNAVLAGKVKVISHLVKVEKAGE